MNSMLFVLMESMCEFGVTILQSNVILWVLCAYVSPSQMIQVTGLGCHQTPGLSLILQLFGSMPSERKGKA